MYGARLDDRNFVEQMCRFGFFAEQVPPCFSSESLARHSKELVALVGKSQLTYPTCLSIYKTQTSRRIVSVANPYAFLCATKFMHERRKTILDLTQSENSESPITFIQSYSLGGEELERVTINSEAARTTLHARSDYAENLRGRVSLAMGCRYRLSIDITSCYDTIYTHSLSWAVCGKRDAKQMFSPQNKGLRTADYQFANELDKRMRDQKGQETNGILIGLFTSRIFSEIILCGIDKVLRGEGYVFRRYVDDYKFCFRTEADARRAIIGVEKFSRNSTLA